jgi:hypothetical protein
MIENAVQNLKLNMFHSDIYTVYWFYNILQLRIGLLQPTSQQQLQQFR